MMRLSRRSILLLALAVLFVFSIGVAVLVLWDEYPWTVGADRSSVSQGFVNTASSERGRYAGWLTLTSPTYNYALRYPNDWYAEDEFQGQGLNPLDRNGTTTIQIFRPMKNRMVERAYPGPSFSIASYEDASEQSLRTLAQLDEDAGSGTRPAFMAKIETTMRNVMVDGRRALRYTIDGHQDPQATDPAYIEEVLVRDGRVVHDIEFLTETREEFEQYRNTFETMLDSLVFQAENPG